jgi:hypothetical protein
LLLVKLKYEGFVTKFFDWPIMGGGRIIPRSPKTTGNEKFFKPRPKIFLFKIIIDPFIFPKNSFSKI